VTTRRFLDTNILLRYLTRDDEAKAEAAFDLLMRTEDGTEALVTSPMVIFETVFTLAKSYGVDRATIRRLMEPIISMRGLQLANKQQYLKALEFYESKGISFADAWNASFMLARRIPEIYSWDGDFDHIQGISRVEPA
jgi:predicted nucleic acid-binding protein